MLRRLAALLLPLAAGASLAAPQRPERPAEAQAPTFPSQVDQVVVDVVVTDRKHSAVTGLEAADMIVLEDGVPQTIVNFEAVEEGMPFGMGAEFGAAVPDEDVGAYIGEMRDAVAGADQVASESGGFTVGNTNDLAGGIRRIANESRAYYPLGYVPTNGSRDGRFRKIEVKLAAPDGLRVRARRGYYAPGGTGKDSLQARKDDASEFRAAFDSPWEESNLTRQFGFPLTGAPPGEYEIVMTVRDELSGRSIELHEPFTAVPTFGFKQASGPAPAAPPATRGDGP